MKKNLISVVILALVFANFVLTALLMFSVLPETKDNRKCRICCRRKRRKDSLCSTECITCSEQEERQLQEIHTGFPDKSG